MVVASERLPNVDYEKSSPDDIEELEVNERGVSCIALRDHTSDIFLKTYLLFQSNFKEQGTQLVYDLIL